MAILNGRSLENHGLPIELYHPVFDEFRTALNESTPITITHDNYLHIARLCIHAAEIYETESHREEQLYDYWNDVLGVDLRLTEYADGPSSSHADRVITVTVRGLLAFLAIVETQNEIGTGHCDPATQASFSYQTYWAQLRARLLVESSNCPSFLIAIAGPHIRILGAVLTRSVIVKPLTDWIQLDIDPADDAKLDRVARVLLSLRASLQSLRGYYEGMTLAKSKARFYPHIRSYPGADNKMVSFHYLEQIGPSDSTKPVFKAQTDSGQFIVVKFVQRYSSDAHRLLAGFDLAPALLYSGLDEGNTHGDCASLKMVVMEFVKGRTAYDIDEPLSTKQFLQVQKAVEILHADNFVFGDLRLPNIMVDGETAKLIDFDWCAKEDIGKYPNILNVADINWHPDVKRGGPMKKEHDDFMLKWHVPVHPSP